jgi:cytochrome c biogenesis protein CcdA
MSEGKEVQVLLSDWLRRFTRLQRAHRDAARGLRGFHFYLGIPTVVLMTFVGTSIFATLETANVDIKTRILVGIVSVTAGILSALQTFLRFAERAEKHRVAGARFGALRREVEQELALPIRERQEMKDFLDTLRERNDKLAEESPEIPHRIWQRWGKITRQEIRSGST